VVKGVHFSRCFGRLEMGMSIIKDDWMLGVKGCCIL
jgi:hypothetical protein